MQQKILKCISEALTNCSFTKGEITNTLKSNFQRQLVKEINDSLGCQAEYEYSLDPNNERKDRCDVYASTDAYQIMIELDATRADQIAKKMLSRYYYAHTMEKPVIYVCLLYPGTASMNREECVKYMEMGKDVLLKMNHENHFIGAFINDRSLEVKVQ